MTVRLDHIHGMGRTGRPPNGECGGPIPIRIRGVDLSDASQPAGAVFAQFGPYLGFIPGDIAGR